MKTKITIYDKEFLKKILSVIVGILGILLNSCSGYYVDYNISVDVSNDMNDQQKQISASELHQILTTHFGFVRIKLSDSKYILPANQQVIQMSSYARYTIFGADKNIRAGWDCDDYAIAAMAPLRNYAFGAMYITTTEGQRHVINVFVNDKRQVIYWEPQICNYFSGQFYKPELIIF